MNRSEADYTVEAGAQYAHPSANQEGPDRCRPAVVSRADRFYPARPVGSAHPVGRIGSVSRQTTARATYSAPPGTPAGSAIRCGLRFLRDMSTTALDQILAARAEGGPFLSLRDFLTRANPPYPVMENLILARAFDWTGQTIPQLLGLLAGAAPTHLSPPSL